MSAPNLSKPALIVKEIKDPYIQKNFQKLTDYFGKQNQLQDFAFLEIVSDKAVDSLKVAHALGFVPKDLLVSKLTGPGAVTVEYPDWDEDFIFLSSTGAFRLRCFVGTYWNDKSTVTDQDTQLLTAAPLIVAPAATAATALRAPTKQTFTSGSGTYTRPTPAPLYIRVRLVGGGGGGAGGGAGGTGGVGGATTFGANSLMVGAGGGGGGPAQVNYPGSGGAASSTIVGAITVTGSGGGSGAGYTGTEPSGTGGASAFGGGGRATSAIPNGNGGVGSYGGGGGGGGVQAGANGGGCGAGAGGYVEAIISGTDLLTAYPYSVGTAGSGAGGGGGGGAGGNGGSGIIIVEEFYQ